MKISVSFYEISPKKTMTWLLCKYDHMKYEDQLPAVKRFCYRDVSKFLHLNIVQSKCQPVYSSVAKRYEPNEIRAGVLIQLKVTSFAFWENNGHTSFYSIPKWSRFYLKLSRYCYLFYHCKWSIYEYL